MIAFSNLIEWFKTTPRYLFAATLVSGTALFLPNDMVNELGLTALRNLYRPWLGGVFLVAGGLLAAHGLTAITIWLRKEITFRLDLRRAKQRLHDLTPDEKKLLAKYLINNTRTQIFPYSDGVVSELEALVIIRRASDLGTLLDGFPYNIQPWAWKHLRKHPELVGIKKYKK